MRKLVALVGVIAILEGLTGVLNQIIAGDPTIPLRLFDHFNRLVVERAAFLDGYEIWANAALAVVGVVLSIVARARVQA
ncbi:hypothetical protein [Herbidospora yilanensis]|uniref:hypothetical protein n=1 Tax=Herbidospora yilanensis TaxID=354426 RepID=UPI0007C7E7FC|nr:hypothetical protein [Herbidospora yilanensis]